MHHCSPPESLCCNQHHGIYAQHETLSVQLGKKLSFVLCSSVQTPWGCRATNQPPPICPSSLGVVQWDFEGTFPRLEELQLLVSHVLASSRFASPWERSNVDSTIYVYVRQYPKPTSKRTLGRTSAAILRWSWGHQRSRGSRRSSMQKSGKALMRTRTVWCPFLIISWFLQ